MSDQDSGSALLPLVGLALALLLALPIGIVLMAGGEQEQQAAAQCTPGGGAARSVNVDVENLPAVDGFTPDQLKVAAVIMTVAQEQGLGENAQLIGIMVSKQESQLGAHPSTYSPDGNGDSGVFQQRQLPGWYGTLEQVNDPTYAATTFYTGTDVTIDDPGAAGPVGYHIPGLTNIKGWESMSLNDAAQKVQRSGTPDAYGQWENDARRILQALSGANVTVTAGSASDAGGAATAGGCASGGGAAAGQAATSMDELPRYPVPEGCTDQTPVFSDYGPDGLNGNVPDTALCAMPSANDAEARAQTRAVAGFNAMNEAFRANFGHDIYISSTYRTFDKQVAVKREKGRLAATPGWSNHGYGLALDLSLTTAEQRWIQQNGPTYGWWHPLWARPDGSKPEPWHYEYGTWLVDKRFADMDRTKIAY